MFIILIVIASFSYLCESSAASDSLPFYEEKMEKPDTLRDARRFGHKDFPNFFAYLQENEARALINKAISSTLKRLQIPYTLDSGHIERDGFFDQLNTYAQQLAPGSRLYIAGGVVRTLLSYIYKKIYNEHKRATFDAKRVLQPDEIKDLVHHVFGRIIRGQSRKITPAADDGALFDLYKMDKDVEMLTALGIDSDLDILIEFPGDFKGNKEHVKHKITDFINSAESTLGLRDDKSALKKSLVPIGDVKDYHEQLKRTMEQGGGYT